MNLKNYLHKNPKLKKRIHRFIMHPVKTRPYWWIRILQPIYIKKGKGAVIYRSVRKDLPPFHQFRLGKYSVIEDYSCLNNAVGDTEPRNAAPSGTQRRGHPNEKRF